MYPLYLAAGTLGRRRVMGSRCPVFFAVATSWLGDTRWWHAAIARRRPFQYAPPFLLSFSPNSTTRLFFRSSAIGTDRCTRQTYRMSRGSVLSPSHLHQPSCVPGRPIISCNSHNLTSVYRATTFTLLSEVDSATSVDTTYNGIGVVSDSGLKGFTSFFFVLRRLSPTRLRYVHIFTTVTRCSCTIVYPFIGEY
jgi:hypothetical protein